MLRTASMQALLIAVLAALASFCALKASAGQPAAPRRYSIVAQSSKATAATGRRPLSQRIAASNLPLLIPIREGCNEHGCPTPGSATPLVKPPVAEESPNEPAPPSVSDPQPLLSEADDAETDAAEAKAEVAEAAPESNPAPTTTPDDSAVAAVEPEPVPAAPPAADALLERVKTALAAKQQQAKAHEEAAPSPPEQPLAGVPARLEFNVRESRSLVKEGEQIVMRLAVRNVGGEPAAQVNATLFFAEGMEPVQAIGHSAEVYPGEVRFGTVQEIQPGDSVDLLVTAIGTRPGSVTYRGELECSQLGGRIAREGAVTVRPRKPAAE
ncbi:MAG: hypothetical protein ACK54F_08890 [Planctomycetia bacterium]